MSQTIPFEETLRVWIAEATIPQVIRVLEIIKEDLKRRNLLLEYDVVYVIPET